LQPLVDADTTACVLAERAVARALAGSCEVPLGAYALMREGRIWLRGFVARPDGSEIVRAQSEGAAAAAEALGKALAEDLRAQGAEAILADIG
jgi:hydroxymethylbilane synthase